MDTWVHIFNKYNNTNLYNIGLIFRKYLYVSIITTSIEFYKQKKFITKKSPLIRYLLEKFIMIYRKFSYIFFGIFLYYASLCLPR